MFSIIFKTSCGTKTKCWNILRICCFSKNLAFNAIAAFQQGQECHGPDIWKQYEKFGIDILGFADSPMHLLYLGIKKYIISMIPTLSKQRLIQNQDFGRLANKWLDQCRESALDWCNANKFTNKDGSVRTKGWESSHYQAFTRVTLSIYSHFDSILNEDKLKCNSYKSFRQL